MCGLSLYLCFKHHTPLLCRCRASALRWTYSESQVLLCCLLVSGLKTAYAVVSSALTSPCRTGGLEALRGENATLCDHAGLGEGRLRGMVRLFHLSGQHEAAKYFA